MTETMQAQLGESRHQTGVLQGRIGAVQAENVRLQADITALWEAQADMRQTNEKTAAVIDRRLTRATRLARGVPAKPLTRRKKAT